MNTPISCTNFQKPCKANLTIASLLLFLLLTSFYVFAQNSRNDSADGVNTNEALLNQYVKSKGNAVIVFDETNIKQFWIDNSVISRKDSFEILLEQAKSGLHESVPLKIQLANVNERLDCKVEIISETEDIGFSVLNNKSKVLSSSKKEDNFLKYSIVSSVFHLEESNMLSFVLKFNSKKEVVSIKQIILSFSDNKESSYLVSPGTIHYTPQTLETTSTITDDKADTFTVSGKRTKITSPKKIITADNTLTSSVTVKNIGENATTIYIGYGAYSQNNVWLNGKHYPYKPTSETLNVVSIVEESYKIIVDSYPEWDKGCFLALNAKDDMSDIPNNSFLDGTITEVKKIDNGQAEITVNKPLKKIEKGMRIRIHGKSGAYRYTEVKVLQPGEEHTFTSSLRKDDSYLEYPSKGFPRGVYYVVPVILSYSVDSSKENTILISNFTVSY
jgi:hypothetical protein